MLTETEKSNQLCCVVREQENSGVGRKPMREMVAGREGNREPVAVKSKERAQGHRNHTVGKGNQELALLGCRDVARLQ
jgi:hypothetical protein